MFKTALPRSLVIHIGAHDVHPAGIMTASVGSVSGAGHTSPRLFEAAWTIGQTVAPVHSSKRATVVRFESALPASPPTT